ncbi:MAG TPA: sodium/proline symporter PutP [Oscillospiraceae bacterium]|nr:sodium/proline symporter PutP [Oscillospiraceae bacterium]HPK36298.1 sodium/proline symporter PutP [Oscillospiraceae bacterium]HPR75030.1 sodium/proline symporter PutP [Oscillospiraceae bacterium]
MNYAELGAFILYFLIVVGIGVWMFFKTRGGDEKDYFLGGRKMGSWVAALSASASDMSAWLLMGLPGSILAYGMGKVWIAIGLLIGTFLNWQFTAPRLRRFSKAANDSITIPQYLTNRFKSEHRLLQIIPAIVFLVCYAVYAASSFKACGMLFNSVLGIDYEVATAVAAGIILLYTFLGGFAAVCWTDFIQGMLMLAALLITPIVALGAMDANAAFGTVQVAENYWNLIPGGKLDWNGISTIISGLAWGLGYFGMPHILVRFMSIKEQKMVKKSKWIAVIWTTLGLCAAVAVALVGRIYLSDLPADQSSLVFINMVRSLFPAFLAGILLSAILAASMSTADSQLLVSASAFTSDVYKPIFRKKAGNKEMLWVGRGVVALITVVAFLIAVNPNSGDIMDLVENAWAGFGSAFGPVILLSLGWKKFTAKGAVAGIIGGALTDVLWLLFLSGSTGIYELAPGFIVGCICAVAGTMLSKKETRDAAEKIYTVLDASEE